MKRFAMLTICVSLFSALALAETWNGTLVDLMCKTKDLANHTKECALHCGKAGFGLVLSDGKFMKFDEEGNAKALAALKATSKEKDLKAKVTGALEGEIIKVQTIEIQ